MLSVSELGGLERVLAGGYLAVGVTRMRDVARVILTARPPELLLIYYNGITALAAAENGLLPARPWIFRMLAPLRAGPSAQETPGSYGPWPKRDGRLATGHGSSSFIAMRAKVSPHRDPKATGSGSPFGPFRVLT